MANRLINRGKRKSSTASPRWCAPRSASTRAAATRSRSSTCASPRQLPRRMNEPSGWLSFLQFTKADLMHWVELAGDGADERQVAFERRLREQVETIVTSVVGPGRARRAAHRRFRLQPRDADLRAIRSGRPRAALEPDARGILRPAPTARKARSPSATSCRAASAPRQDQPAPREQSARPRKSSTTRFRARPRPK